MKTVGIIAEFNPFHNGHAHFISEIRDKANADYVVIVMSGSFVQRGEPSIMYKYDRVLSALLNGADVVLELPVHYSTASAEAFAFGGVSILDSLNVIDYLGFGSECGSIGELQNISNLLLNPNREFNDRFNEALESGKSYPAARSYALSEYSDILDKPNNILGIEYIKALNTLYSSIVPITYTRTDNGYNSDTLDNSIFASAKAIRNSIINSEKIISNSLEAIKAYIPDSVYTIMNNSFGINFPIEIDDLTDKLEYILLRSDSKEISTLMDLNVDLANRFYKFSNDMDSISEFLSMLKTKEITYTRLSRAITHILLNLSDLTRTENGQLIRCPYTRILGFKESAAPLMHKLSKNSSIPLISKAADAGKVLSEQAYELFNETLKADRIYDYIIQNKYGTRPKDGCLISPIII